MAKLSYDYKINLYNDKKNEMIISNLTIKYMV